MYVRADPYLQVDAGELIPAFKPEVYEYYQLVSVDQVPEMLVRVNASAVHQVRPATPTPFAPNGPLSTRGACLARHLRYLQRRRPAPGELAPRGLVA